MEQIEKTKINIDGLLNEAIESFKIIKNINDSNVDKSRNYQIALEKTEESYRQ